MGTVTIRPRTHRKSPIETNGLQIGTRGDRWEEEFIKNVDFSTMDNPTDWSYLFRDSKAYDFDLSDLDSSAVINMDYMFNGTHASTLRLSGLTVGAQTSASYLLSGSFDAVDFTGAIFYSLPQNMLSGATIAQGLQLRTLDVSNLTSLSGMFQSANLASLDLTGFDTHTITDMSSMFNGAIIPILTGLNTLDYSHVTNMNGMFNGSKIPVVDLSGINFVALETANTMFQIYDKQYAKIVNLSGCKFPVLTEAAYMFYSYTSSDWTQRDRGLTINLTDAEFTSLDGLNAYYMFGYLYEPDGLDLSCFSNTQIINMQYMFYYAWLGETDFSVLDFSKASSQGIASWSSTYYGPVNYCRVPSVHIQTEVPYNVSQLSQGFSYYVFADEVTVELTCHSNIGSIYYLIYFQHYGSNLPDISTYIMENSELYASSCTYFIYFPWGFPKADVTVRNTTLHIGNNGAYNSFIYLSENAGTIDLSDMVIDGTFANGSYFIYKGYTADAIYLPSTGIKFKGALPYFIYQSNSNCYTPIYNLDKVDVSEVTVFASYTLCGLSGTYDLTSWDVSHIQSIGYNFIYYANADMDLSGWDLSSLQGLGNTLIYYSKGNFNLSNWNVTNIQSISGLAYDFEGNIDLSNWRLTNCTYLYGISVFKGGSIDFNGWEIPANQNLSNCQLLYVENGARQSYVYVPDTVYQPTSYTGQMFTSSAPSQYYTDPPIIDLYTNATSIENQGWKFSHIYSAAEPYGYRIHLNTTHEDFLEAIGGDD